MNEINVGALIRIKGARPHLSAQQYRTLRGQVCPDRPGRRYARPEKAAADAGQQRREKQKMNVSHETKGAEPMEERRIPTQKPVSETITISVAEYHFLTKAATLLEIVLNAQMHDRHAVVEAAQKTVQDMQRLAEEGAAE